jgi:hypothetical protein
MRRVEGADEAGLTAFVRAFGPPVGVRRREDEDRLAGDEIAIVDGKRLAPETLGDAVGQAPRVEAILKPPRAFVVERGGAGIAMRAPVCRVTRACPWR